MNAVPVWELKGGDLFTVPSIPNTTFRFHHMDGMYCFATSYGGKILNWSGNVDRVEPKESP